MSRRTEFTLVNQLAEDRVAWAFWAAGAVALVGGLLPLAIGGTSSRIASVGIPFTIAALAFVACGFVYKQGRGASAILYFIAGLALVYGLLAMFSVPLQLAALGSCAAPPAPCGGGLQRPLTLSENTGMGFATGFAVAALFIGFFGLMVVFRRTAPVPSIPPTRRIPPVAPHADPKPAPVAAADPEPEQEPELPAHVEEELPELPAHESEPSTN